jgi:hypothetical protein
MDFDKLQDKLPALQKEHELSNFFGVVDSDPDPLPQLKPESIRRRINDDRGVLSGQYYR